MFYKQLLEAVNRGIKFALSDLEDDEELSSIAKQKTGQINDVSWKEELIKNAYTRISKNIFIEKDLENINRYYKQFNLKYKVLSKKQLLNIIDIVHQNSPNNIDLNWIDISNLTDLTRLFAKLKNLNIDCSEWDTRHVEKFNYIFAFSSNTNIKANNWQFDSAKEFDGMFYMCKTINVEIDAEHWHSENVKSMTNMFNRCSNQNLLHYASKLDISGCQNFGAMFADSKCDEDLSSWKIPNNVPGAFTKKDMNVYGNGSMVYNCYNMQHHGYIPKIVGTANFQLSKEDQFRQNVIEFCKETNSTADLNTIKYDKSFQRYNCDIKFMDGTSGVFRQALEGYFMLTFNLIILDKEDFYPSAKSLDNIIKKCKTAIRKRLKILEKNKEEN